MDDVDPYRLINVEPFWRCESCGYNDHHIRLLRDREAFYKNPKPKKCPKCKSVDMMPVGY